ncbi:MAG: repressor LexA [Planctomycetaceae bacterium]|nr:transcriptional repressor LexA [Planctomycetota bacterium]NUN52246.1 repressor LexA [Planctomycetaceae bacterium]
MAYTEKQRNLLEFVARYQREHGISPTLEEIGDEFGISRVTAFQHVSALKKRGALAQRPREARSLEILDPAFRPMQVLGTIAAGGPIEAVEAPAPMDLQEFFPTRGDFYMLQVRGDSMIEDHIEDGDYVLVERRTDPRDGDTVVAILPGDGVEETTLKRFYREPGGVVRLEPRNARLQPIRVREVEIRGVVKGVLRKY